MRLYLVGIAIDNTINAKNSDVLNNREYRFIDKYMILDTDMKDTYFVDLDTLNSLCKDGELHNISNTTINILNSKPYVFLDNLDIMYYVGSDGDIKSTDNMFKYTTYDLDGQILSRFGGFEFAYHSFITAVFIGYNQSIIFTYRVDGDYRVDIGSEEGKVKAIPVSSCDLDIKYEDLNSVYTTASCFYKYGHFYVLRNNEKSDKIVVPNGCTVLLVNFLFLGLGEHKTNIVFNPDIKYVDFSKFEIEYGDDILECQEELEDSTHIDWDITLWFSGETSKQLIDRAIKDLSKQLDYMLEDASINYDLDVSPNIIVEYY